MDLFKNRFTLYLYLTLLVIGMSMLFSGYFFASKWVNYALIVSLIGIPLILYGLTRKHKRARAEFIFFVIVLLGIFLLLRYFYLGFFSSNYRTFETQIIEEYKIEINKGQGWAGPPSYKMVLKKTILNGILEKTVGTNYPGTAYPDSCYYEFSKNHSSEKAEYIVDRCNKTVQELE